MDIIKYSNQEAQQVTIYQPVSGTVAEALYARRYDTQDVVNAFLRQLQCKECTRRLYARTLPQFFRWVRETGRDISTLLHEDIIAYADALQDGTIQKQPHWSKPKVIKEVDPTIKHRTSRKQREAQAAAMMNAETLDLEGTAPVQKLSKLTAKAYLTAVRLFYRYLAAIGAYSNIAEGVKILLTEEEQDKTARMELTEEEASTLCASTISKAKADNATVTSVRDAAIINLLLMCGLRTIEVSRANIEDLREENNQMHLYIQGKGHTSKDNFVPLNPALMQLISNYLATRTDYNPADLVREGDNKTSTPLFIGKPRNAAFLIANAQRTLEKLQQQKVAATGDNSRQLESDIKAQIATLKDLQSGRLTTRTISGIAKEGMRAIGIDNPQQTAHSLRHTYACIIYEQTNWNESITKVMMRHTSENSTRQYNWHKYKKMREDIAEKYRMDKILGIEC